MINLTREEAQQVLDALIWTTGSDDFNEAGKARSGAVKLLFPAIETLSARLSAPEPEPVAWFMERTFMDGTPSFIQVCETDPEFYTPLYRAPQPEPKDDGYCQACEGDSCTAKTGCVTLSNPPDRKWDPLIERLYSPDGTLLSEKIKYTRDGEWQGLTDGEIISAVAADFNFNSHDHRVLVKPLARAIEAKLREKNT